MQTQIKILALLVFMVVAIGAATVLECGECLPNGVACANQTAFYMCDEKGVADKTEMLSCSDDEVCTGLQIICAPEDSMRPVCGDTSSGCSSCGFGGPFTCISQTRYAFCSGSDVTNMVGKCPDGYICDSSSTSENICVKACKANPSCIIADP